MDINLFVSNNQLADALRVLSDAGVLIDLDEAHRAASRGDVLVGRYQGMRVDLFTPSIPFSWEAMKTRVWFDSPLGGAFYLSAEASVIFKLLFFRAKDLVDVEKLVAVQGATLMRDYIRAWMVDMMGEGDERIAAWDSIAARNPPD